MKLKEISPAMAAVLVAVVVVVALVGGIWYLNRPHEDSVQAAYDASHPAGSATQAVNAPMGGAGPPKAGSSDYGSAAGSPRPPGH